MSVFKCCAAIFLLVHPSSELGFLIHLIEKGKDYYSALVEKLKQMD